MPALAPVYQNEVSTGNAFASWAPANCHDQPVVFVIFLIASLTTTALKCIGKMVQCTLHMHAWNGGEAQHLQPACTKGHTHLLTDVLLFESQTACV